MGPFSGTRSTAPPVRVTLVSLVFIGAALVISRDDLGQGGEVARPRGRPCRERLNAYAGSNRCGDVQLGGVRY